MTVSQAPGAVAPSGTSGTVADMPTAVSPTTVDNKAPFLTGGASSPPPATTTSPLIIPPITSGPPATSDPPITSARWTVSAQPHDMTGKWLMKFTRSDGSIERYTITLKRPIHRFGSMSA